MSRIATCFSGLKQHNRKALITFITAGDPTLDATLPLMHAMVESGVDIIELGVAFSDPMAEGPVIQQASERALHNNAFLPWVLQTVAAFRQTDRQTPVVLMGYLNPVEFYGYEQFAKDCAEAGVDGVLTVDMPVEEAEQYRRVLLASGLDPIFLLSPTSPAARIEKVARMGSGFIYYVSLKGVTGADSLSGADVGEKTAQIRQLCPWPLAVGFGIKDAESVKRVAAHADAVVVGSALISCIESCIHHGGQSQVMLDDVKAFIGELRHAL